MNHYYREEKFYTCREHHFKEMSKKQNLSQYASRNLKGDIGSLFDPCVNAMGQRPYCPSRMKVSYCTFGFGVIIRCDLLTSSLPHDSLRDNQYACVI